MTNKIEVVKEIILSLLVEKSLLNDRIFETNDEVERDSLLEKVADIRIRIDQGIKIYNTLKGEK